MARQHLAGQLTRAYLFVAIPCVFIAGFLIGKALKDTYVQNFNDTLRQYAQLAKHVIQDDVLRSETPSFTNTFRDFGAVENIRVSLILPDGRVIADTELEAQHQNESNQPEIRDVLTKKAEVSSERFSRLTSRQMHFVAVPIMRDTSVAAIVRVGAPSQLLKERLRSLYLRLGAAGLGLVLLLGVATVVVTRRTLRPLTRLGATASNFAQGNYSQRAPMPQYVELANLAHAMNEMAVQLSDRMATVTDQQSEQETILASMEEGVLAIDANDRLFKINAAAASYLGVESKSVLGRSIQESIRSNQLLELVASTSQQGRSIEEEITLGIPSGFERVFQAHGSVLRDAKGRKSGVLVVLTDLTRLRKLENVRREFVANVSHELRTPLTSLHGYIETLLAAPLNETPENRRFLETISRHVNRLTAIIEDLLSLSRLESRSDTSTIEFAQQLLLPIIQQAVEALREKARESGITIRIDCPQTLSGRVNGSLLHQAMLNLIDNAIRYSSSNSVVTITAQESQNEIKIAIRDEGVGIPVEHHERIYERFYRVDKGRSRSEGGTGLGLAIVKHIVVAHGGRISVDSAPGKGSTFTVSLPKHPM